MGQIWREEKNTNIASKVKVLINFCFELALYVITSKYIYLVIGARNIEFAIE